MATARTGETSRPEAAQEGTRAARGRDGNANGKGISAVGPSGRERGARSLRRDATKRVWPWLGLVAVTLGYFATWAVQFPVSNDALMAGGETLLRELKAGTNETLWRVTSGVGYVSVGCLVWFAAGLRRLLDERAGGASLLPEVVFGSFLVTGGALIVTWAVRAQVFDGIAAYGADPSSHVTINRLSQDTGLASWAGLGSASAALAVAGLGERLVPTWLGWFSAVMTVCIAALCLAGVAFPANVPAGIWLLVTAVWAIRQTR
jgi:hypothetical protein